MIKDRQIATAGNTKKVWTRFCCQAPLSPPSINEHKHLCSNVCLLVLWSGSWLNARLRPCFLPLRTKSTNKLPDYKKQKAANLWTFKTVWLPTPKMSNLTPVNRLLSWSGSPLATQPPDVKNTAYPPGRLCVLFPTQHNGLESAPSSDAFNTWAWLVVRLEPLWLAESLNVANLCASNIAFHSPS